MENDAKTSQSEPVIKLPVGERLRLARIEARKRGMVMGMKKGTKMPKTLAKEAIEKSVKQIIMNKAEEIVRATIIPALGMNFVYRIDTETDLKGKVISRKHVLVSAPEEIAKALDQMEEGGTHPDDAYYYVTTKAPEYKAGESLLNRLLGKPKESLSVDVKHKFSLKDLGRKADAIETRYKEVSFTEDIKTEDSTNHVENVEPEAI